MAGGIDWFRWHHGSVTDPKFQLVARKAGARFGDVVAVWAYVLEAASASDERGQFGPIDAEAVDCMLGADDGTTARILAAMQARGLTDGGAVSAWEKRQPKREDDTAAERKRRQREREHELKMAECVTGEVSRTVTQGHDRGEESREEVIQTTPDGVVCPRPAADGPQLALVEPAEPGSKAKAKTLPDCPHVAVLALWAEVLPSMPQHNADQWRGSRADHLRARWRETAVAKGWESQDQGLTYFRRLFGHVGRSPFLTGKEFDPKRRPFFAELAWLVEPLNWAKVHEGKFHQEAA